MHDLAHINRDPNLRNALLSNGWKANFTKKTVARGQQIFSSKGIVSSLMNSIGRELVHIHGVVLGNYRADYETDIEFHLGGGRIRFFTECTCPVGYQCKHAAALLFQCQALLSTDDFDSEATDIDFWIHSLQDDTPEVAPNPKSVTADRFLAYCLHLQSDPPELSLHVGTCKKNGEIRINTSSNASANPSRPPGYMTRDDLLPSLIFQNLIQSSYSGTYSHLAIAGPEATALLLEILDTNRLYLLEPNRPPAAIRPGAPLHPSLEWTTLEDGGLRPTLSLPPHSQLLPSSPLLAITLPNEEDVTTLHRVESGNVSENALKNWALGPEIPPAKVAVLTQKISQLPTPLPVPDKITTKKLPKVRPTGRLTIHRKNPFTHGGLHRSGQPEPIIAELHFLYHGHVAPTRDERSHRGKPPPLTIVDGAELLSIPRHKSGESDLIDKLCKTLGVIPASHLDPVPPQRLNCYVPDAPPNDWDLAWAQISTQLLPALRNEGWEIHIDVDARVEVLSIGPDNLDTGLTELPDHGIDWFQFDASYLTPNGDKQSLLPLLSSFLKTIDLQTLDESLQGTAPDDETILRAPDGHTFLSVNTHRLLTLAKAIHDLFGFASPDEPLHRVQAASLADSLDLDGSETQRSLADLGKNLKHIKNLPKPTVPKALTAELRDYQIEGFHWMQFLARHSLHGILADDMGLGKTLQALTHIQAEVSGRRTQKRPTLVIAPTSVTGNWKMEAEKFAPKLKVLLLHGSDRKDSFPLIPKHHLIITSYALLVRDFEQLSAHDYHLLILDEAQYVKNPASKMSQLCCKLAAAHRISLSGTPLENHLGELWSQMRFLMPGLLGSSDQFRKNFRTPIERHNDGQAQLALNRRVAPLLLRRTKEEVATELPPKTEILHTITLHKKQVDLYEMVRAAMDKRVRDAISDKGLAKSQIIVLDALLKLRQICCHPQLLKLPAAKKVAHSAKLDFLTTDLLPALLEDGRRILLFSSFTSMLSLIEKHLEKEQIPFSKITGNTKDRQAQVNQFQTGETPIFLISLKAGGTGLNLTTADTVIHYDPWWNPAAENQATDRAHRIGQSKPVFVHKLICEGTIEQRIQELQSQKAALVEALLTADTNRLKLDQSTLNNLLAPLPGGQ